VKSSGYVFLIVLAGLFSCRQGGDRFVVVRGDDTLEVSLRKEHDSLYYITMAVNGTFHSEWALEYPVYRFDYGVIREGGQTDIAVGVSKPTRFDPKPDKRLFLFRITDDYYIRPLWLGSRVAQPLVDFRLANKEGKGYVRTIEKEKSGAYLVAAYRWQGFGLTFAGYEAREIPLPEALMQLHNNK
jgi:hypothetical protein